MKTPFIFLIEKTSLFMVGYIIMHNDVCLKEGIKSKIQKFISKSIYEYSFQKLIPRHHAVQGGTNRISQHSFTH